MPSDESSYPNFLERYPSINLHITEKDVQDSLEQILILIDKIRSHMEK